MVDFPASPDECEENKQLDHDIKITSLSDEPFVFLNCYFIKSMDRIFYGFIGAINQQVLLTLSRDTLVKARYKRA